MCTLSARKPQITAVKEPAVSASLWQAVLLRDGQLALRNGSGWLQALIFMAVFGALGGLAVGPEPDNLRRAAPGLIWLGFLLAQQLIAQSLFRDDVEDGTLAILHAEQGALLPYIVAKFISFLLIGSVPLILLTPLLLTMFAVPAQVILAATTIMALGAPGLCLANLVPGAVMAAAGLRGLFGTVLAAPLVIPIVLFGIGAMRESLDGSMFWSAELMFMLAISLIYAVIMPLFALLATRAGVE